MEAITESMKFVEIADEPAVAGPQTYRDRIFQLKFTSKQLTRQSKRCERDEQRQKLKLKQVYLLIIKLNI
jgi:hypothetical protein